MQPESTISARLSELQTVLKGANDQFAANLHVTARSILLYRIAGSSDRRSELDFLLGTIKKIKNETGNSSGASYDGNIITTSPENRSVGQLFSMMTDVLDVLSPSELYKLVAELRKEPIHSSSYSDDSEFGETTREPNGVNKTLDRPNVQVTVPTPMSADERLEATQAPHPVQKSPEESQKTKEQPPNKVEEPQEPHTESAPGRSLEELLDQVATGNVKIDELTNDLIETRKRLESFEKDYNQSNQRLEVLKRELSKVPRRLEEIDDSLTSMVRDAL